MEKLTISMAMFNSYVTNYRRVLSPANVEKCIQKYHMSRIQVEPLRFNFNSKKHIFHFHCKHESPHEASAMDLLALLFANISSSGAEDPGGSWCPQRLNNAFKKGQSPAGWWFQHVSTLKKRQSVGIMKFTIYIYI